MLLLLPTVTAKVIFDLPPGFQYTLGLNDNSSYLQALYGAEDTFIVIREGGVVTLGPDGSKMLAPYYPGPNKGIIRLFNEAQVAGLSYEEITCTLAEDDKIRCEAPSVGFADLYLCGSYIYLGKPGLDDGYCYNINGNIRMDSS